MKKHRRIESRKYLISVVLIGIILGISLAYLKNLSPKIPSVFENLTNRCFTDLDCTWKITNCCTENAGGSWDCINKRTYTLIDCEKFLILCPQVISPKPGFDCFCNKGSCEPTYETKN